MFKTAKMNGLIGSNTTEGVKIPPHATDERIKALTIEQQDILMKSVTEPRARVFCALCIYAGLRKSETLGLVWSDMKGNELTVRRSTTFVKKPARQQSRMKKQIRLSDDPDCK